jgi:hypothetical protein
MARRTLLLMSKRSANCLEAGAIIEEETGLMNVNADTVIVACHFLLVLQLHTSNQLRRTRKAKESDVKHTFLDFLGHLDRPNQR